VHYRDPETGKYHLFISTLPESINPGTIAMLYYKRWTIEKAFNNSKSNLKVPQTACGPESKNNNDVRVNLLDNVLVIERVKAEILLVHSCPNKSVVWG